MRPSNRLAGSIKPRRQTIEIVRPIHIVLDVLLAAPDHLHRTIDVLGDLDGQHRAIGLQPSAEATANQMIVNFDRILWQAGEFGHQRLRERRRLCPDPNVATILLQMNGAVHRLHRRMGQERHLINGFESLRRLRKSLPCIAIVTGNHARLFGFLLQLLDDTGVADLAIRPVVPRDGGSLDPLRSAHSSGVSPSTSTSWGVPLIFNVKAMDASRWLGLIGRSRPTWTAVGRPRGSMGACPYGRTRMIVFPLRRSVGFKAATASSRVETLPMFVRSRPSRTRWTISLSWARSDSTTKSTARPSAGRASAGPTMDTSVPPARIRRADRFPMSPPMTSNTRSPTHKTASRFWRKRA